MLRPVGKADKKQAGPAPCVAVEKSEGYLSSRFPLRRKGSPVQGHNIGRRLPTRVVCENQQELEVPATANI